MSVVESIREAALADFAIKGPRTAKWCVEYLGRQQQHPEDYHRAWRARRKLGIHDYGVVMHQTSMRAMGMAGCSDQLDLANLSCIEYMAREAQMIEHFYQNVERELEDKQRKDKKLVGPTVDEMELFVGADKSPYDVMVCPALAEWIAKEMERDANIQKQSRKARQERALPRK